MDKEVQVEAFAIIGRRLRALRDYREIKTQGEMARLIGATTNQYNNWETGASRITIDYAMEVCRLTGATMDYIYRGELSALPGPLAAFLLSVESEQIRSKG